ncbi:MAG: GNAT family N-acetyltransferase, partial [Planctomycetes bacterium]|nr:GNAT family N-acetyltransferase [Planctomycetota bacterium]
MSEITIRDLTLQEASLAGEFFHRWWRPEHVFYTNPALLKWMYHENPLARTYSEGLTFKAAFRKDDVVGVFAYFPFALNRYGHRSVGVNLSAWWVHPDHRRGSLGVQLLNSLQHRMGFEACISGMNTPIAETLYARMGWVVCRCIPRWLFVVHPGSLWVDDRRRHAGIPMPGPAKPPPPSPSHRP